jgi:hydrogenase maturation protein HypF
VQRRRIRVQGIVQGVGFRPFIYRTATRLGLSGFVQNDSSGLVVEVEGPEEAIKAFTTALVTDRPPLAVIEDLREEAIGPTGTVEFEIRRSAEVGTSRAPISPDIATCDECLAELSNPLDRRYGYAFTNCTDCGPRFTITTAVPYDRPHTTMAGFAMCEDCRREYLDPSDRRFHAQPIACPRCGPRLEWRWPTNRASPDDPIAVSADHIRSSGIVAIKGLGGYHLACDAGSDEAVLELRRRKNREEKPFAVMVSSLDDARAIAVVSDEEAGVLASPRRPIVLLRRLMAGPIAESVAPGNRFVGVMLPYTPLHHLLLAAVGRPVVMTSGNLSEEPIVHEDGVARERLAPIADAFLTHDRPIHIRCDDSVVRVLGDAPYPLRRSRGFAPEPLSVVRRFERPLLAVGGELKNTFCIGIETRAIMSQHVGDLENFDAMQAFTEGVRHFLEVFDIAPAVVAYDLHPDYMSSKWALSREGVETVGVQHHHAHIASCLADNRRAERVIGLALDGTGYGLDGDIWGCEVLACDLSGFDRLVHLRAVPMPGGAAAIREPWRMGAVYLNAAFGDAAPGCDLGFVRSTSDRWSPVLQMADAGINSPRTTSAGRMFDAAAAVCGLRDRVTYEGQAAAEFEQIADPRIVDAYTCTVAGDEIDGVELIAALAEDLARGRPVPEAAAAFHNGLAGALVKACEVVREAHKLETVALSGGTWQNLLLLHRTQLLLVAAGFEVLTHRRVPPNDGGIALGQAVVANAARRAC